MSRLRLARFLTLFLFVTAPVIGLRAAPPPLREQISLNGEWPVGGAVPTYAGIANFGERDYERDVDVPAAWAGRVVQLEFGAVNFVAEVFVDGERLAEHVGGWNPFAVDVSRVARPGGRFHLKVHVKGPTLPPIVDEHGAVAWPIGGWKTQGGIADDVWLRAYGPMRVTDAFIQTSVARHELRVDYTVHNSTAAPQTITIAGEAIRANASAIEHRFTSEPVMLAPGETKVVPVVSLWRDAALYWPDEPVLYHLRSRIVRAGETLDTETRRFGFREIALRANQFFWNGVRANLYGDYQVFGDTWYLDSARWHSPEAWPATVDKIKAMNIRILRWHHNPVPQYLLDVCDEKGLLVCDEAPNYARDYHAKSNQALYLANAARTVEPWIRADRNHPSIYLWNATNEMTHSFCGPFKPDELVAFGETIRRYDPTRPIAYDGDNGHPNSALNSTPGKLSLGKVVISDSDVIDYHYPEGYNKEPVGSIYGWGHLVFPKRPTGSGEMLHTRSPDAKVATAGVRNTWWLGLWLRGLRYTNWTNVKPACWWFTEADLASSDPAVRQRTLNLRNALAPVALFDKAYDDLGIEPYVTGTKPGGTLPTLTAGAETQRTLVLYNDEFRDEEISVEVSLVANGAVLAQATRSLRVPLGEHREFSCRITPPADGVGEIAWVLRTRKGARMTFEEARRFRLVPGGTSSGAARIALD